MWPSDYYTGQHRSEFQIQFGEIRKQVPSLISPLEPPHPHHFIPIVGQHVSRPGLQGAKADHAAESTYHFAIHDAGTGRKVPDSRENSGEAEKGHANPVGKGEMLLRPQRGCICL